MSSTIVRGKFLISKVTGRHEATIIDQGAALVRDGVVQAIGPYKALREQHGADREIGNSNHVVVPGFVNSHHHVGLTPLQLGSPDYALELWFASRMSARRADLYLDTLYSAFEMVESGITTVQHMHGRVAGGPDAVRSAADEIMRAYADIGMRVSYSYALRDQNRLVYEPDDDFVARLPAVLQPMMRAYFEDFTLRLDDQLQLFERLHEDYAGRARQRVQLAPANLHWCSDDALAALEELSSRHAAPMHMHLLETAYQKEYALRRTGKTAVAHLEDMGMLGPRLTLGHGTWLSDADIEMVAGTGTHVCHNCSSNFRLRSGVAPLNELTRRGVNVGIGLDEAGINDDRDMLQEMRMVLRAHRTPGMDDGVATCQQVLRMATEHGAMTTPFGKEIGTLEVGRAADLALIDWNDLAYPYLDQDIDPIDALVQRAKSSAVSLVMVQGEVILENGRFTRVDKAAALAELAGSLDRADTPEEARRREFARQLFPHVRRFYDGYLDNQRRVPHYQPSSKI